MGEQNHVVITGASSGLGAAMAHRFAQDGAALTLSARREDKLNQLRDTLIKAHPGLEILVVPADVSDKNSMKELVLKSVTHFGRLDSFIANAGLGMWCRLRDVSDPDELKDLMNINYMGVVYGLFYALPHLRKSKGSFVAISSIQGTIPIVFHTGYVASKYAVNGLIDTIRLEEPDVHFLLALPSWISGTELRAHALAGNGEQAVQVKTSHGKSATSAEDCAEAIITSLSRRESVVFIPKKYRLVPLLRNLLPSTFDSFVMKKVKGQLK